MSIFLTGSSGFVGKNIVSYFGNQLHIKNYRKGSVINIQEDIVIHLAGKAHDLKNTANVEEYYVVNTELTKHVFDNFLESEAKVFITLSSVKAVADELDIELTEDHLPNPITHYGKSKLFAEEYIFNKGSFEAKRVYILRPCMIHGPGNKGNLNLLFNIVNKKIPWPLGAYRNKRSFCSIDNLCFVIKELIENENIPSGIYNIADDEPISTNEIIDLIGESTGRTSIVLNIPKFLISSFAKFGDLLKLPLNTERLAKLTETYIVNNSKIKTAIGKQLPISSKEGLLKTFKSFSQNV
jgi:nucleoside-diphosphate-sugar epimerase